MNADALKDIVAKLPTTLLLVAYLAYLGFQYYSFDYDDASPKKAREKEIVALKQINVKLTEKYKQLDKFAKSLEVKKVELRGLAKELQEVKTVLTENFDVPGVMKLVTTEAKKLNFSVLGLKPMGTEKRQFYGEATFVLNFKGVYTQLVAFLDRLSNLNRIVQADKVKIASTGPGTGKFVLIEGEIELKVFNYIGSTEDSLGSGTETKVDSASASETPPPEGATQ